MLLKLPQKGGGGGIRVASTLILVRKGGSKSATVGPDYKILLVQRSKNSTFMNSAHVFPGGCIEDSDRAPGWATITKTPLLVDQHEHLYHRICGLRETFEETGILLGRREEKDKSEQRLKGNNNIKARMAKMRDEVELDALRGAVTKSPQEFWQQVWVNRGIVPDVNKLFLWDRWITPVSENRRYDTFFYLSVLDAPWEPDAATAHRARPDGKEISNLIWMSPAEALQASRVKEIILPPPTAYIITQLQNLFPTLADMQRELANSRPRQIQAKLPTLYVKLPSEEVKEQKKPTAVIVLPGDDLHEAAVEQAEVKRLNVIGAEIARGRESTEIEHQDFTELANYGKFKPGVPAKDDSVPAHRVVMTNKGWQITFDKGALRHSSRL